MSVFGQSVEPSQIIVVDDGSMDGTAAIMQRFADLVIGVQQANLGSGAARNAGLRRATGDYIAFLDADDYWRSDFIDATARFMTAHPEVVAVNTGGVVRLAGGREQFVPAMLGRRDVPREAVVIENFFPFWAKFDHVRTGTVLLRRATVVAAGDQREDLSLGQDLEYWAYIATWGTWGFIPQSLWVGDALGTARCGGWRKKYAARRRLCPTVAQWEARVRPRVAFADENAFRLVRGRVAAVYAHAAVVSGNWNRARQILQDFGLEMPGSRAIKLLRWGHRGGYGGWVLACALVELQEYLKAARVGLDK